MAEPLTDTERELCEVLSRIEAGGVVENADVTHKEHVFKKGTQLSLNDAGKAMLNELLKRKSEAGAKRKPKR